MGANIVCHIGLHKTASGTLQRQFFPACGQLRLYTTLQTYTRKFIHEVTCRDPAYFEPDIARQLLAPHLSAHHVNLLSNESLSGPPYAGVVETGLDHRTPVLQNLHAVFPDARILIVLRRQDTLARSLYRQYLKRGGTASIDRFYRVDGSERLPLMSLDRFIYSNYLERLQQHFPGRVKILLFEDFLSRRGQFLEELCRFLEIEAPKIELDVENATRLGPIGMEASRYANFIFRGMLNRGPLPSVPWKRFGRWTVVSPVELLHDYWPGRGRPGERVNEVCDLILKRCSADNQAIDTRQNLGMSGHGYY